MLQILLFFMACKEEPGPERVPPDLCPSPEPLAFTCDQPSSALGDCQTHWDCDGSPGCETEKGTTTDCGACGIRCEAGEVCLNGLVCAPADRADFTADNYPFATRLDPGQEGACVVHGTGVAQCRTIGLGGGVTLMDQTRVAVAASGWRPACVAYEDGVTCRYLANGQMNVLSASGAPIVDAVELGYGRVLHADGTVSAVPQHLSYGTDQRDTYTEPVLTNVVTMSDAQYRTCGVHLDGTVTCIRWPVTEGEEPTVVELPCVADAVDVAVGHATCVLHADGEVSCTGQDWTAWRSPTPDGPRADELLRVPDLHDVVQIEVGYFAPRGECLLPPTSNGAPHWTGVLARRQDGSVMVATPDDQWIELPLLHGAIDLSSDPDGACGLMPSGDVVCQSHFDLAELAYPPEDPCKANPEICRPFTNRWDGSVNHDGCAVVEGGALLCFGRNVDGRLALPGGQLGAFDLVQVDVDGQPVTDVKMHDHVCALTEGGGLWCWGSNQDGQLGVAAGSGVVTTPTQVFDDVIDFDVSNYATCAVRSDHTLWCVGRQILPGRQTADAMTQVSGVTGAAEVELDGDWNYGKYVRLQDGTMLSWGGAVDANGGPVPWCAQAGVDEIVSHDGVLCARSGTGWGCSGINEFGALGPYTTWEEPCPVAQPRLDGAVEVAPGSAWIAGVHADGAWVGTPAGASALFPPGALGAVRSMRVGNGYLNYDGCALKAGALMPVCWKDGALTGPGRYRD